MVIDMFKNKKNLTADFHDVISGDEWELDCSCHEFSYSFPVCNHTESVNEDNIGFIQGYMNYSVPFEAELFTNYMNEIVLGIVMPVLGEKEIPLGHCKGLQKSAANAKGNVLGMVAKVESWDNSVLTIGMVMDMEEEDINVCIAYWQGYGYADKIPNVKIMVVGQDYGNPDGLFSKGNNIRHILSASDGSSIQYLGGIEDKDIAETDLNLVDIFKEVLDIDIRNKRHHELFFTNFCLGYRTGNDTGGMTTSIMMKDAEYFKKLCDIIAPEKIICLGQLTYESVVFALKGTVPKINGYNNLLNKCVPEVTSFGKKECRIYASAHTGYYGMLNRNKNVDKDSRKKMVINDWKKIFDKVVKDTEKKLIGFESEWESWDRCDADAISMYKVSLLGSNRKIIIRQATKKNPEFAVFTIKVDKKNQTTCFLSLTIS